MYDSTTIMIGLNSTKTALLKVDEVITTSGYIPPHDISNVKDVIDTVIALMTKAYNGVVVSETDVLCAVEHLTNSISAIRQNSNDIISLSSTAKKQVVLNHTMLLTLFEYIEERLTNALTWVYCLVKSFQPKI